MATTLTTGARIAVGAGAGLVVGALMPWAVLTAPFVGQFFEFGTDGYGLYTGGFGILTVIAAASLGHAGRRLWLLWLAVALASGGTAAYAIVEIARIETFDSGYSLGPGLYVTAMAAGALLWACVATKREATRVGETPRPEPDGADSSPM